MNHFAYKPNDIFSKIYTPVPMEHRLPKVRFFVST